MCFREMLPELLSPWFIRLQRNALQSLAFKGPALTCLCVELHSKKCYIVTGFYLIFKPAILNLKQVKSSYLI